MKLRARHTLRVLLFLSVIALLSLEAIPHTHAASSSYYVASLDATIDPGAEDFVVSAISDAQAGGATHFILILDTFGGAGSNMDNIIHAISDYEASGGTFTTLIGPSFRHAFSAGAYIAESSTQIVMVNATEIGSATPIITGIPGEELAAVYQKDVAAFATYMSALTQNNHRNATAAALMVTQGVSYDNVNASINHVIDQWINVSTISGALAVLGVPSNTEIHYPGLRSQAISILSDPNVDALLFLIGSFAILIDFTHPTLILSVIGATALVLALFGFGVFGASLVSIILMLLGAVFIFLELKTHHGISALIGVAIFVIGFFLIFRTPTPPIQPSPTQPPSANFFEIGLLTYGLMALIAGGGILMSVYLWRVREQLARHTPHFDAKSIIGKEGRLLTDLKAGGVATANIGAEEWSVTAKVDYPKDTVVRVREVQGLKLVVEKMER